MGHKMKNGSPRTYIFYEPIKIFYGVLTLATYQVFATIKMIVYFQLL